MNLNRVFLVLALAFPVGLFAAPAALHVVKVGTGTYPNQIETVGGNCPIRLVGVNVDCMEWNANGVNSGTEPILTSVQKAVTAWHANCVRIAVDQDWWDGNAQSSRGATNQATYPGLVTAIVNYCQSANVYCDIDLQWSGDGPTGSAIGQYSMPDQNSLVFWKSVATLYANNTSVLFDTFNEPYPTSWSIWSGNGTTGGNTAEGFVTPGLQAIINTIRATGAANICIAGGQGYSYNYQGFTPLTDPGVSGGVAGNGIVYSAHIYNNKGTNTPAGWE